MRSAEGPHGWDQQLEALPQERDSDPGGPNIYSKGNITLQIKNNNKYPCYRIRDTQSLKDKLLNEMYNNYPCPGGSMSYKT